MTVQEIEEWLEQPLPEPYRGFLETVPEEMSIGDFVLLYGRAVFVEFNEICETKKYCPHSVTIGNDSGGQEILLALRDGILSLLGAGALGFPEFAQPLADDFSTWLSAGCPLPED